MKLLEKFNLKSFNLKSYTTIILILIILMFVYKIFIKKDPVIEGMATVSGVTYEALQNISSMYKNNKLKISELEVTGKATINGQTDMNGILNVNNRAWIKNNLNIEGDTAINGHATFNNQVNFNNNRTFSKDVTFAKKITCEHELRIINGGGVGPTIFNENGNRTTHLRGKFINFDKIHNKDGTINVNGNLTIKGGKLLVSASRW